MRLVFCLSEWDIEGSLFVLLGGGVTGECVEVLELDPGGASLSFSTRGSMSQGSTLDCNP